MSNITKNDIQFNINKLGYDEKYSVIIKSGLINVVFEDKLAPGKAEKLQQDLEGIYSGVKINIIATKNINPNNVSKIIPPGVKHIVMVSSCKGGVGKSTMTSLLASTLSREGVKVGVIDADIFGPSIPLILGTEGKVEVENGKFVPKLNNGIKTISMGNVVDAEKAAVWRGPMVSKVLYQLMMGTNWGELDILLVDTPPGTGDVALSLLEKYEIDGAILVTTPHALSVNELVKSIDMFSKLNVPVIGVIENMSYYLDNSGNKVRIFGESELASLLESYNIPLVEEVPITDSISKYNFADIDLKASSMLVRDLMAGSG